MGRDLSDSDRISALERKLERYMSGAWLENASVTNGRLRFIGGLLLIDSGGTLQVIGQFNGNGDFEWSGPWKFDSGDGEIAGDVKLTGDFDLIGRFTSLNVRIEGGKIYVGEGDNQIVIDGATGRVIAGNVIVESDKITIGGTTVATLENGEFTLSNGAKLQVGLTGGTSSIGLVPEGGAVDISANNTLAWMRAVGAAISVSTSQARVNAPFFIVDELPEADSIDNLEWVARDKISGRLFRVPPGVGGPGGDFEWPYDLTLVTSEFGPRVHPVTGEETMHNGIDFGPPAGTPIPAIGRGTVTTSAMSGGFGNLVVLDHGTIGGKHIESYYAHMQNPGAAVGAVVAVGEIVGLIGSTGLSTGPHLHLEIHEDGVPINPRDFMARYGV